MTPRQRVLLTQLQLCGMGIIFLGFGIAWSKTWLIVFGITIIVYGLARWLLLKKLMDSNETQDSSAKHQMDSFVSSTVKQSDSIPEEQEDQEGEYVKDEWESKLESYLKRHYDRKHADFYSQTLPKDASQKEAKEQKTNSASFNEKSEE